jgi:hypothetical protein
MITIIFRAAVVINAFAFKLINNCQSCLNSCSSVLRAFSQEYLRGFMIRIHHCLNNVVIEAFNFNNIARMRWVLKRLRLDFVLIVSVIEILQKIKIHFNHFFLPLVVNWLFCGKNILSTKGMGIQYNDFNKECA